MVNLGKSTISAMDPSWVCMEGFIHHDRTKIQKTTTSFHLHRLLGGKNPSEFSVDQISGDKLQGGPLLVTNGVITYNPYRWPYKWVTGVTTLGVRTCITGWGPPCRGPQISFCKNKKTNFND